MKNTINKKTSDIAKVTSHPLMKKLPNSERIPKENAFSFILDNYLMPKPHDLIRYYEGFTFRDEPVTLTDEIVYDLFMLYMRLDCVPDEDIEESDDIVRKDVLLFGKYFLGTLLNDAEENSVKYTLYNVLDEISELYEFFFPTTCLNTMEFQKTVAKIIAAQKNPDENNLTLKMMDMIDYAFHEGIENETLHPLTLYPFSAIEELPIAFDFFIPVQK